jgi:hypothetical protein
MTLAHHLDEHAGARHAARPQPLAPPRMRAVGVHALVQPGDRHRRLALPEQLVEPRPEQPQRLFEIGDVHRPAAVIDRLQIGDVGAGHLGCMHQPGQHRRRREERDARLRPDDVEDVADIEMRPHDLVRALEQKGQGIEPRPMRHRRGQ